MSDEKVLESLIDDETRIRVSSTLDKSVGKKYLTDGSPETCWTSQQGLPQFIHVAFAEPVIPRVIHLTFQGGFVGKRCAIYVLENTSADSEEVSSQKLHQFTTIYPEDVNRKQSFEMPELVAMVEQIKLVFEESSDFFGRITVYDFQVEGYRS